MMGNCTEVCYWSAHLVTMPEPAQLVSTRHPEWELSQEQRREFARDGFLVVEGAMPAGLVESAVDAIDAALAAPGGRASWDQTEGKGSVIAECMDLWRDPRSPALSLVESLLGPRVAQPIERCQVALRFPERWSVEDEAPRIDPRGWHVDGTIKGVHSPFTLLLGVALSDVPTDGLGGGLVVYPGTHLSMADEMRAFALGGEHADKCAFRVKPPLQGGIELKPKRGAVVLVHQKVCHTGGPNLSDMTRYCVYFRISHVDHGSLELAALHDPMLEFEGCHDSMRV
eukprot:TRINITY_DN3578_c0_g1_i1.p1 TRINITY_DN3578_c0_g1~~TRINITY_DN3578_c0_g1_i1.p1  ORF type:complete len:284 (+),score=45.30 TRINITY_DN3578_c0_g1_i1:368-1219(+)